MATVSAAAVSTGEREGLRTQSSGGGGTRAGAGVDAPSTGKEGRRGHTKVCVVLSFRWVRKRGVERFVPMMRIFITSLSVLTFPFDAVIEKK